MPFLLLLLLASCATLPDEPRAPYRKCSATDPAVRAVPLLKAAADGNTAGVKALLDDDEDVNHPATDEDRTPLICAIENSRSETARLLLQRDASPNRATASGRTPLIAAAVEGDFAIAVEILKRGANPNHVDADGKSALHYAVLASRSRRALQLAKVIVVHPDADVNLAMPDGTTALGLAARAGNLELVKYLLDHGGDTRRVDAASVTDAEVRRLLESRRARQR